MQLKTLQENDFVEKEWPANLALFIVVELTTTHYVKTVK